MRPTRILMLLTLLFALSCAGGRTFERGIKQYKDGDYGAAAETFAWVEEEKISLSPKNMVRYLMYRGLNAYHQGKMPEAKSFLGQARAKYEAGDARWLTPDAVKEMDSTLDKLGQ